MTMFAKSVIFASGLVVAIGWLADGGSVEVDAANMVQQLDGSSVF